MSNSAPPDAIVHPYNRGLAAWIDAGADLADCTAPATAEIGEYAHRLAIPGASHPVHGERRAGLGRAWTWDADRHGWRRTA
jgi:hypothetical protein